MIPPKKTGPALSAGLLKHLGVETKDSQDRGRRTGVQSRKDQRKESRAKPQRQSTRPAPNSAQVCTPQPQQSPKTVRAPANHANEKLKRKSGFIRLASPELDNDSIDEDDFDEDAYLSGEEEQEKEDNNVNEDNNEDIGSYAEGSDSESDSNSSNASSETRPHSKMVSGHMRAQLEQDDAQIAELERKLGMKNRKSLPQSFKDDGLGDLLESLGHGETQDQEASQKNKRKSEADEWLRAKRQKAIGLNKAGEEEADDNDNEDGGSDEDGIFDVSDDDFGHYDNPNSGNDDSDNDKGQSSNREQPKRKRENPYVAPASASSSSQKYIPPALRRTRQVTDSESEAVSRVRRQAHHLIARLSDANMLTILNDVEKLYLDNPRQYVTDAVTDKLLEQIQIAGALSNNVTVLIAGFATAVYMVKGTDFGAHFIQQNAMLFKHEYDSLIKTEADNVTRDKEQVWAPSSKMALNLFSLMAELYNFRMIGPNLIYDYVRMLLSNLTETNTELLLRVTEASGIRLRQDDPRSLKDIVSLIQPAVVRAGGEKSLSARTRHMIDRIIDIKKSDKKKLRDAEISGFGHAERIRKVLGNLPTSRKLEAAGPLRVGLADIEQSDKLGKWWLVGASWAGRDDASDGVDKSDAKDVERTTTNASQVLKPSCRQAASIKVDDDDNVLGSWGDDIADVEELDLLAREQGMNTDARRSIFVTLLSAADCKDAHARLLRLRLNKYEKREVVTVLIRCVGSEQTYNRYYALVARQVCSTDRRMAWVFQASLWKLFRRAGEQIFGEVPDDDEADDDDDETMDLRRIVNMAKLYGYLIACGSLNIDILKCLSLIRLQTKTRMFVEVLLISLFEEAQTAGKSSGDNGGASLIRKRFRLGSDKDDLRRGLQYFIDKVVRKSTVVDKKQAASIGRACDRAQKALRESKEE